MQRAQETLPTILFIFLSLFLYTKLIGPIPFSVQNITSGKPDVFRIDGRGEASGVPNTVVVRLGMTTSDSSLANAQSKTNTVMNKLTAELKKMGISEKDIKTVNYSAFPNYGEAIETPNPRPLSLLKEDNMRVGTDETVEDQAMSTPAFIAGKPQQILGYTVTHEIEVEVKDTNKVNAIIDTATQTGANQIGDIRFTFDKDLQKKLEEQARDDAIQNAKEKAESLSKAAGIRLGKIVDITSYPEYGPYGETRAMNVAPDTGILPGEGTVRVNVNLAYETL